MFQPVNLSGAYGNFAIDANGNWFYSADNTQPAIQALNPSQTVVETFTVTTADGTLFTVTININGTDDPDPIDDSLGAEQTTDDSANERTKEYCEVCILMAQESPDTHDQWIVLQCKHCAMHMGFITLDAAPSN